MAGFKGCKNKEVKWNWQVPKNDKAKANSIQSKQKAISKLITRSSDLWLELGHRQAYTFHVSPSNFL